MPTRITERRLPLRFTAADLGQATADAAAALISFHSSPIVRDRRQTYVVFVLDAGMQGNVEAYRWQVGGDTTRTTAGVFEYVPAAEGDIEVRVTLLGAGDAELKTMTLAQSVIATNGELAAMIARPDEVTPVAADPETSREIVNDVRAYIDEIAPRSADPNSSMNRLLFAIAYAEALNVPPPDRSVQLERLAAALGQGAGESFADQAAGGVGLCQVRPQVLGMYVSATEGGTDWLLARRELPGDEAARPPVRNEWKAALANLNEAGRADLFNLLRFPKSNLRMTLRLVEALMGQYFPGATLPAILANDGNSRTLISQFKEGPFAVT